jgi:hypothetical protein
MYESHADRPRTSFKVEPAGRPYSCFLRHWQIVFAVALLACGWPQQGALAKIFPPIGDHGDVQLKQPDLCPTKNFLIGLRVRVGDWMDQLALICGQLDSNGSVTGHAVGQPRGGVGGAAPVDMTCGANEIMTGVAFLFTPENRQVRLLSFHCVPMKAGSAANDLIIGNKTHGPPTQTRQDCPPDEAINGLMVNYGQHVNAVGIACAEKPYMAPPPRP